MEIVPISNFVSIQRPIMDNKFKKKWSNELRSAKYEQELLSLGLCHSEIFEMRNKEMSVMDAVNYLLFVIYCLITFSD